MKNWINFSINQNTYNPTTVGEVVSNKQETIHKILFENALALAIVNDLNDEESTFFSVDKVSDIEFFEDSDIIRCYKDKDDEYVYVKEFTDNIEEDNRFIVDLTKYKIHEDLNNIKQFYEPSSVIITKKLSKLGFGKIHIYLGKYWENEYNKEFLSKIKSLIEIDEDYPFNDIIYYDYINGKAKLENRVEGKTKWIRFGEISEDDNLKIQQIY